MSIKRLRFLLFLLTALLLLSFFNSAEASELHNIRGRAQNTLYGYISFNCLDDDGAGRFPFTFPFAFNIPPCLLSGHGVNLDTNNNFSGLAWNPSLGYIDFAPDNIPPDDYAFNIHCLSTCDNTNDCTACYNEADQRIYGWGQVVKSTDLRWIELNGSVSPPTTMTNYTNPQPGIFSGYASTDDFGPISFNCSNDSSCYSDNYYVWLWKLELKEMSAPNWSYGDACNTGARKAVFKWSRRGGIQTAYRVIINTSNSTSSPVFDSGQLSGDALQLICPGPWCDINFNYNTSYYWWLQLWNEDDEPTEFFQFDTEGTDYISRLTDNIAGNSSANPTDANKTFTTYKHEFPTPYFIWDPFEIIYVGSSTDFISQSHYYSTASPNTNELECIDGVCDFEWETSDPNATISSRYTATTSIIFVNNNPQNVYLTVTDPDLYTCSTSSPSLFINYQLPIWKEVKAQ
jgi:hypothetical protein